MRTIAVVTGSRADYGIYLPILRRIEADPKLKLVLLVTGMHLSPEFGSTVQMIERDGFPIGERIETLLSSDTPEGIGKAMGLGVIGFSQAFSRDKPDILMVLGDRFEMHAAALAALPFKIPVAHIHGGEVTSGAIDDSLRHSLTKLSHLHFVATETYAQRVIQLGEAPWRVIISGAPGLDHLHGTTLLSREELEQHYEIGLDPTPLLVTFHPVTLEYEQAKWQIQELLAALEKVGMPVVFTLPNADTAGRAITQHIRLYTESHPQAWIVENFGTQGYLSMMTYAAAMVGNSSSGIVEAASFKLPVVNIGNRQQGRTRAINIIDTEYSHQAIIQAIQKALSPDFRAQLEDLHNPYGNGHAAEKIVSHLKTVSPDQKLLAKRFYDLP